MEARRIKIVAEFDVLVSEEFLEECGEHGDTNEEDDLPYRFLDDVAEYVAQIVEKINDPDLLTKKDPYFLNDVTVYYVSDYLADVAEGVAGVIKSCPWSGADDTTATT